MANAYAAKLRSLATTNLAILSLRLVQFFFAGMVVGLMGYYIKSEALAGVSASSPYVFVLVVGVLTMLTQFVYCFNFYHPHVFLWDACVATGWIISLFWLLNFVQPLACPWSAFNPFGSNQCGQTRAVLVIQILMAVLWYITALIGLVSLVRSKKKIDEKA